MSASPPDSLEALAQKTLAAGFPAPERTRLPALQVASYMFATNRFLAATVDCLDLGLHCLACRSALALGALPPRSAERHSWALRIRLHPSTEAVA